MRKVFLLLPLTDQLDKFIPSSPTHALSTGALQTPLITLHQFASEGFKKLEEKKTLGEGFSEGPEACDERAASSLPTHLSGAASIYPGGCQRFGPLPHGRSLKPARHCSSCPVPLGGVAAGRLSPF